ncbi:MAG: hypothetical protein ACYDH5_16960 [Acidimicrobiales bacterium]
MSRPDRQPIHLSEERWAHIVEGHPELWGWRDRILSILAEPGQVVPGRRPGEEWLYGTGGPSRWLKVVVQWDDDRATVVTAFARRRMP